MICITCGRDNPSHLIFCQECGGKLTTRRASATPVIGLSGPASRGSYAGVDARSLQPKPSSVIPQRPPAPEVNFASATSMDDHQTVDESELEDRTPPSASLDPPCPLCGHRNSRSLRFCVTCGRLLAPTSLPPPIPPVTPAVMPPLMPSGVSRSPVPPPLAGRGAANAVPLAAPPPAFSASDEPTPQTRPANEALPAVPAPMAPIAPGRVVDLGAPAAEAMLRLCPRCRGGSEPTSNFCRFCGASLADAPAISLAPRTPPPLDPGPGSAVTTTPVPPPASSVLAAALASGLVRPTPLPPPQTGVASAGRSTVAMVSPAGPAPGGRRARLVLIARDGGEGPSYPLGEVADIGRLEGNILLSDDRYVSPRHARIQLRGGAYYLRDLSSTNGVFVRIPFARASEARPTAGTGGGPAALACGATVAPETDGAIGGGAVAAGGQGVGVGMSQGVGTAQGVGAGAGAGQGRGGADGALAETSQSGPGGSTGAGERGPGENAEQTLMDQDLFLLGQQVLKFEVVRHADEGFGVASDGGTLVFGTPAAPRYARLCQRTVEGVVRDVYHLQKAETIIGREVGDLVFTEDPFLSRRHAAVVVHSVGQHSKGQRRYSLMDLGSSNGTFLQLREEIRLKNGDHLRIGQQLFRFDLDRMDA